MPCKVPLAFVPVLLLAACADRAPTGPAAAAGLAPPATATAAAVSTVMSGLDSPRGLAFGPDGGLYVAEAGTPAINGPCTPVFRGENCYSGTGAISRLLDGRQERVASGLPSNYNPATSDITGPHDVAFQGLGGPYVSIGWGASPASRAGLGSLGSRFGTLVRLEPGAPPRAVADVTAFEGESNPGGGPLDSNPYGLLSEPGRHYITDAGGNSLVAVNADGNVSLVATFPPIPVPPGPLNPPFVQTEAVPTEVARGPDGALYVSALTGVPFAPGTASIYRVVPGEAPTVFAGGFTQITDFAWAGDGTLYVLQYASAPFLGGPGAVIRVGPDRSRTTVDAALTNPTGIVVGPEGALYVSNRGNVAGVGEVLRIDVGATGESAPPTVVGLRADPAAGPYSIAAKACGGQYTACLRFRVADPDGAGDGPFAVTVNWGDGTAWTPNRVPADVPLLAPHSYTAAGSYPVTVTVADRRGATSTARLTLVVTP